MDIRNDLLSETDSEYVGRLVVLLQASLLRHEEVLRS